MYDYIKALKERFYHAPEETEWNEQIQKLRYELASHMDKQDRKLLLRLLDAESLLQEEISLTSFAAGFRLAWGIVNELSAETYSYEQEC